MMVSLWSAIIALSLLALVFGVILGFAAKRFAVKTDPITDKIDALLPQSQCGQCGYPGCRPYAEAISHSAEKINLCAPGGEKTMLHLAELLGVEPQPFSDQLKAEPIKKIAFIDESNCIGCTKCIQACPVDAIIGSNRTTHTVISELCTGCDLCVAPCPTDCIEMRPIRLTTENWQWQLNTIPVRLIDAQRHV